MGFIRLKKRKLKDGDKYYAYLVKNKWSKKLGSPRQNVSKYLGRVYETNSPKEIDFLEFHSIKDADAYTSVNDKNKIIADLIEWELAKNPIEDIKFSKKTRSIVKDKKEVVLKLNHNFMCGFTIRRLYNFQGKSDEEREIGMELAKTFTEAGIKIPSEIFIGFFDKVVTAEY